MSWLVCHPAPSKDCFHKSVKKALLHIIFRKVSSIIDVYTSLCIIYIVYGHRDIVIFSSALSFAITICVFGGQSLHLITPRTLILDYHHKTSRTKRVSYKSYTAREGAPYLCTVDGLQYTTTSGLSYYFLTLFSMAMSIYIVDPELLPDMPPCNAHPTE